MLRHPVVITSLEEDFRKIGLLTEANGGETTVAMPSGAAPTGTGDPGKNKRKEGDPSLLGKGYKVGGDKLNSQSSVRKDPAMDYVEERQRKFESEFDQDWDALERLGVEEIELDDINMAELETMAESVLALGPGGLDTRADTVSESLKALEQLAQSEMRTTEAAIPAFANMALIAEQLYQFYTNHADLTENADSTAIAGTFGEMAKFCAGVVDFLKTEAEDTVDFDKLGSEFRENLQTLLQGIETSVVLREQDDDEDEEEDDEEDDEEGDEGEEEAESKRRKTEQDDDEDEEEDDAEDEGEDEEECKEGKRGKRKNA